jgi:hypothetical protein
MKTVKLVYFGAGGCGKAYYKNTKTLPDIFVDNDESKWGTFLHGVEIMNPEVLSQLSLERLVITTSFMKSVYPQILSLGVEEKKIYIPPKSMWSHKIFKELSVRIEAAEKLNKIMTRVSAEYSLVSVGGTALGFCRNNDFIQWDDDIDLFAPIQGKEELMSIFNQLNIRYEYHFHPKMEYILFFIPLANGIEIDSCVKFFDSTKDSFIDTFEDHSWEWPTKMFTQCAQVEVHGNLMNVPYPQENYLSEVFGSTWAKPNPNFSYLDYGSDKS